MDDLRARFVAGDDEAIRAVIAQYGGAVQTIARSMMSEPELISEVVQQTFIKAWKAAGSFDPDRELAPWLYSIARRTDAESMSRLRAMQGVDVLTRDDGTHLALFESKYWMDRVITDHPELTLERMVAEGGL